MELCLNVFNYSPRVGSPGDVPTLVAATAAAGFPLIGLDVYLLQAAADHGVPLATVRQVMDDCGVACFEVPGIAVGADDQASLEMAKRAAEAVHVLGAAYVLTIVSASVDAETTDRLERCADVVVEAGGRLGVEFVPTTPLNTMRGTADLCAQIGFEKARVLLDTWHFFRGPDTWEALEAIPTGAIGYVQFDDALPLASDDLGVEMLERRAMPGDGEFELDRFTSTIRDGGFDGVVSVEVIGTAFAGMEPYGYAAWAMATTSPYWL